MRARQKGPHHDISSTVFSIRRRNLENVEALIERSFTADLITARDLHEQFELGFRVVAKVANARQAGTIFVAHREIMKQVFDGNGTDVLARGDSGQTKSQLPRYLWTDVRKTSTRQVQDTRFEGDGETVCHRAGS